MCNRGRTVLLSAERRRDRRVLAAEELSGQQIEAIRKTRIPEQFAELGKELQDWMP